MKSELLGKSTVARRKAATSLSKGVGMADCDDLLNALQLEERSTNSWETKVALMRAVGALNCKGCSEYLWNNYVQIESGFDLVDMYAASAYVRLVRQSPQDCSPILELIEGGRYPCIEGGLEVLGYDRVIPTTAVQLEIIERCWDFGKNREKGRSDPRYGLAAACAGWNSPIVPSFLAHCRNSDDEPLKYVTDNALKGKYVKLR